jgi:hypothetical protein
MTRRLAILLAATQEAGKLMLLRPAKSVGVVEIR